jgi:hypothetical protein
MPVALVVAVCEGPCVYSSLNPCQALLQRISNPGHEANPSNPTG